MKIETSTDDDSTILVLNLSTHPLKDTIRLFIFIFITILFDYNAIIIICKKIKITFILES